MIRSPGSSISVSSSSRSNWRPTTAATLSTWLAVSESCSRRREIISLTPSGTAIRLSARSSSSGRLRSVSSMKNGLPSVSSVSRRTNCDVTSRPTSPRASSAVRPSSAIRSNDGCLRMRDISSTSSPERGPSAERAVPSTSSRIGAASWSMWPSSRLVEVSAQCRSSRISTTGRSRAAKASIRVTPSKSR